MISPNQKANDTLPQISPQIWYIFPFFSGKNCKLKLMLLFIYVIDKNFERIRSLRVFSLNCEVF